MSDEETYRFSPMIEARIEAPDDPLTREEVIKATDDLNFLLMLPDFGLLYQLWADDTIDDEIKDAIAKGADLQLIDAAGKTILHSLVKHYKCNTSRSSLSQAIDKLVQHGADVRLGEPSLIDYVVGHAAAIEEKGGNPARVLRTILKYYGGAECEVLSSVDEIGNTILHTLTTNGPKSAEYTIGMLDVLIEHGADLYAGSPPVLEYFLRYSESLPGAESNRDHAQLLVHLLELGTGQAVIKPEEGYMLDHRGNRLVEDIKNGQAGRMLSLNKGASIAAISEMSSEKTISVNDLDLLKVYAYDLGKLPQTKTILSRNVNATMNALEELPAHVRHYCMSCIPREVTAYSALNTVQGPAGEWQVIENTDLQRH